MKKKGKERTFFERYFEEENYFFHPKAFLVQKIVLFIIFYQSITFLQFHISPVFGGVFAQLQVLLSIILVIATHKHGLFVAIILNLIQSMGALLVVIIQQRIVALPGAIVPLFTIVSISFLSHLSSKFYYNHMELLAQRLQLQKAKEDAEKANSAKSEFLATMSHEIRTPINSILGFLELISFGHLDEKQKEYLKIVESNTQNLVTIINDILDFSKIEKRHLELSVENFNPLEKASIIIKSFENMASKKNIKLGFSHNEAILCKGDPVRFGQVIINLLGNAIKFTPENGRIDAAMTSLKEGDNVIIHFSVLDNGIGIAVENQKKIFELFSQADASIAKRFGGTGLGLTIAARIVELMKGSISVESEPGKGSHFSFTITLPGVPNIKTPMHFTSGQLVSRRCNALVAEDSADSLKLLIIMLEHLGITADPVWDGVEAFDHYLAKEYDLIFLDGSMPRMNGIETAQKIRDYEETHSRTKTHIIAVSAKVFSNDKEAFLNAGADVFVEKPVTLQRLSDAIKMIPETHRSCKDASSEQRILENQGHLDRVAHTLGIPLDSVKTIFSDFVEAFHEYLDPIEQSLNPLDTESLQKAAHRLKGAAASFLLDDLTSAAADLEKLAIADNVEAIPSAVEKIRLLSVTLPNYR